MYQCVLPKSIVTNKKGDFSILAFDINLTATMESIDITQNAALMSIANSKAPLHPNFGSQMPTMNALYDS
tara:strand:+ start:21330 stop:21539 length:210 start_codon:yes stop_codon:yes gene_type:complete